MLDSTSTKFPSHFYYLEDSHHSVGEDDHKHLSFSHNYSNVILVFGFWGVGARDGMRLLVEGGGGKFSSSLTSHHTHLIGRRPEGDKYNYAIQQEQVLFIFTSFSSTGCCFLKIKIVTEDWVRDCCEEGRWIPESSNQHTHTIPSSTAPYNNSTISTSSSSFYDDNGDDDYFTSSQRMEEEEEGEEGGGLIKNEQEIASLLSPLLSSSSTTINDTPKLIDTIFFIPEIVFPITSPSIKFLLIFFNISLLSLFSEIWCFY